MNAIWQSMTALQAGLTLADMLPQPEAFANVSLIPRENRFPHYVKIKHELSPFRLINILLLLNDIHVLTLFDMGREFMFSPRTVV